MLNKDKIILMTRMASYEATEEKDMVKITDYFRSDYVCINILKTAVSVTLSFIMIVGIYALCNADTFIGQFYQTDFKALIGRILNVYALVMVVYILWAFVLYSYRYTRARKSVRIYQKALKKLISMYGRQD